MTKGIILLTIALSSTFVVMVILITFRKTERMVTRNNPQFILLAPAEVPAMTEILAVAKENECAVADVTTSIVKDGNQNCIEVVFKLSKEEGDIPVDAVIADLEKRTKAINIQVLNHH